MSKPIVAIVGRPNVGKSTLFNVIAGDIISIVKDTPGVTRDRIYADCEWLNMNFTLIDTGGIEPDSKDIILSQMREQAEIAISTADVIVFIVDVRHLYPKYCILLYSQGFPGYSYILVAVSTKNVIALVVVSAYYMDGTTMNT